MLAGGHDFVAAPRLSEDGTQLAWVSWNHPNMPWDDTELWVADVEKNGGLQNRRKVKILTLENFIFPVGTKPLYSAPH